MSDPVVQKLKAELRRHQMPYAIIPLDLCRRTIEMVKDHEERIGVQKSFHSNPDIIRRLHLQQEKHQEILKEWSSSGFPELAITKKDERGGTDAGFTFRLP